MFKKVIALSTAAMILLTPMSASAVSWGEVVNGLKIEGLVHGWQDDRHKGWGYLYLYGRRA